MCSKLDDGSTPRMQTQIIWIQTTPRGPFYHHGLTLIPVEISNYIHYKVWDEITNPFLNFNGATVEVFEWISNFIPHLTGRVITYPCYDESQTMLVKGATGGGMLIQWARMRHHENSYRELHMCSQTPPALNMLNPIQ